MKECSIHRPAKFYDCSCFRKKGDPEVGDAVDSNIPYGVFESWNANMSEERRWSAVPALTDVAVTITPCKIESRRVQLDWNESRVLT